MRGAVAVRGRAWPALGVCLAAAVAPAGALAQQPVVPAPVTVRGVLIDAVSGLPVPRGEVLLTDGSARTLADSAGAFVLRGVVPGARVLRAGAFGYLGAVASIVASDTLGAVRIELEPDPIALSGIEVGRGGAPTVWGVVLDARSGAALPYASVWLRNRNRSGAANERGGFRLSRIAEGDDLLLVSKLGYTSQYVPVRAAAGSEPIEVRLEPDSVVLRGLQVVTRDLRSRRNAYPFIVREFRQERLLTSASPDVATFLQTWASLVVVPCEPPRPPEQCTLGRRGIPQVIRVFIDEQPMIGGMDMLRTYPPHEIHSVELFGRGMVRAYTLAFMERLARRPRLLLMDG